MADKKIKKLYEKKSKNMIITALSAFLLSIFVFFVLIPQKDNVGFACVYPEDSSLNLSKNECEIFANEIENNKKFELVSYYMNGTQNFKEKYNEDYYIILNRASYCEYSMYTTDDLTNHSFDSGRNQVGHGVSSCMTENRLIVTELTTKNFLLKVIEEKE